MDDQDLDRLAGGRVYAPTGVMRYVVIVLLVLFTALVMVGMLWLIVS